MAVIHPATPDAAAEPAPAESQRKGAPRATAGTDREGPEARALDWGALVEQYGHEVWRTAYRLLSNREDANDVYQETFLQAVQFARRQRVTCWPAVLRRIATARALDQLRRRYRGAAHRESFAAIDEPAQQAPTPEGCAQLRESMALLRESLAELPANQATVFWLSEVEMLSHAEIAGQLDATADQVAVWLHRSKKKLRTLLVARGVASSAVA
ncbi:MAG TPA: sigma-70 family RNA polymerase sigma factor [Lacipirellulaceae bacterium]|nr:sigma-70 family RNA polymerase sigma factor [Lacipirellulaceae bacterium]